jgi:cell division protease FtsH
VLFYAGNWLFGERLNPKGEEIKVSEVNDIVKEGNYEQIVARDSYVAVEVKSDGESEWKHAQIKTEESYCDTLVDRGLEVNNCEYKPTVAWADIILLISIFAGLGLFYLFIKNMSQSGNRLMEFGQSKARMLFGKKVDTTFEDVAGIDEVKEEVVEIVDFLKNPKKYIQIGARIPKGVLLVGAPGTGKTLLAKALAGEANVPFFHTSGSEFEEMLVGAGASRVRDLFKKAKRAAPCIIFIDEIDAIAKKRGTTIHSSHTEQTLNQILVEMDGLEERENVIVLAATNRPDILDPAILRPGRFDRTVVVQMPDYEGRKKILQVHAKGKKFTDDADLDLIAKKTVSYSGADLENLLNEAAIMSAKDNRKKISQEDLMEAYLKVKLGRQKKHKRTEEDIRRVAYHEAGHAVVSHFTEGSDPVEKISIVSRGFAGGVTIYVPEEDSDFNTKTQLLAMIQSGVAGKVAEEMFLNEPSTGPANDIKEVTKIARKMIQKYGMSEKLGFIRYGEDENWTDIGYQYEGKKEYSEKTAREIDEEVKRLTDEAQVNARKILEDHKDDVETLVELLLEKEVVDKEVFEQILSGNPDSDLQDKEEKE